MMPETVVYAPGARLLIRDEEWLVKSTLPIRTGGAAIRVVGLSELVRNQEAMFLTRLERIEELKPEETKLVTDDSPQFRRTRLYLESLLRRTPPTDTSVYLGHKAAINYARYQVEPTTMALEALRPRILIADGVGLGKTIEAGILLSELIKRGRGERILIVAIRSMLAQFQEEIWARFAIPLVRLDSVGLQRVRAKIPSNKNPFYYYDRAIISVDTLKNDAQYRHYLEQCHWDVIVIDECHNVANTGSQRNRLATLLARTCDSLILTSATPHNGRPESFANLMNMLEPTAIADDYDYTAEEISGLFVRRFKKDIEDQVSGQFSDREVMPIRMSASPAEEAFFDRLASAKFHTLDRRRSGDELYRVGLLKGFLSSPDACLQTINGRLKHIEIRLAKLRGEEIVTNDEEIEEDLQLPLIANETRKEQLIEELVADQDTLSELSELAQAVDRQHFSKYKRLLNLLKEIGVDATRESPRVIIFSERIATLKFLQENLCAAFNKNTEVITQFHAGLPDVEQTGIVESFGKEDSPIRILLASDVASEGVNLHYYCHLMIHFDIPWSLITLEQRNGRIDRYGQYQTPYIYYLLTISQNEIIRGDLRVVDRLIEKEQEVHKNIGDAATLLGIHDSQKEEDYITIGVAEGKKPQEIIPDEPIEVDWLALMVQASSNILSTDELTEEFIGLYQDEYSFAKAAYEELLSSDSALPAPEFHPNRPAFTLLAPEDLRRRCEFIPDEAIPRDWIFRLTTDREWVMKAIAEARKKEGEWPKDQLFWELHPVMEWLMDRLLVRFGRHEAPVIVTSKMPSDDFIYLFQGVISNQRSQPVITDWFGVHVSQTHAWAYLELEDVLQETGFVNGLPNPEKESGRLNEITENLSKAVSAAKQFMDHQRAERGEELGGILREDMRKLARWRQACLQRIAAEENSAVGVRASRLAQERHDVEALYSQREQWLKETFTTVGVPYIRLAVVYSGI
jgi:ERCC4-related helicase